MGNKTNPRHKIQLNDSCKKTQKDVMYVTAVWIICPYKEWVVWMFSQPKKTNIINRSPCICAHIMHRLQTL
jgi:hypothetical protein